MIIIGGGKTGNARGETRLSTPASTLLVTVGQYYVLNGTFIPDNLRLFTGSADGKLTFVGAGALPFLFGFSVSMKVDKASIITLGIFLNDVLVPDGEMDNEFVSQAKVGTVSSTSIGTLSSGDVIQIRAKSNAASTNFTLDRFNFTTWSN